MWLAALVWGAALCCAAEQAVPKPAAGGATHAIDLHERVLHPEDGLLLGNGDLSVSVYQTRDQIIWRFGKGDVWDRRLDLSDDPKPPHIDEIAHGIQVEGWKCPPYGGPVEATRGTKNPQRMRELCQGSPPSYRSRPYPCPKPVGELAMHLAPDLMGLRIRQRLVIEEAVLHITCSWPSGVRVDVDCFVPPAPNVLVVQWKVSNWREGTRMGKKPPVWFSLYRWADPPIQAFAERFFAESGHGAFRTMSSPKATPLPPPTVRTDQATRYIEQTFPPDPTFPKGFRCLLAPFTPAGPVEHVAMAASGEARLRVLPRPDATSGWLAVAATTTSDAGGALDALRRVRQQVADAKAGIPARWADENRRDAAAFWSRSRLAVSDPLVENLWYETLHARRCAYRRGKVPPGLFLPSTVQDYSHWHGDYHTNYNYQEPFWGDYTANQIELGDSYFAGVAFMLPIGRKIARDYYNCRGVFFQLTEYPILAKDDPLGAVPMGRMAYMTGWMMHQYWWRYRYTLDAAWLRETGYPVIRDCALFYTDFLRKGADGLYHAFPSNQGEDGFSGDPKDYTDRPQVMQHARYCLRVAIQAAEALGVDEALRAQWRDRVERCAGDDGRPPLRLEGLARHCHEANPPEFGPGRPYRPQAGRPAGQAWPRPGDGVHVWYFGQYPWSLMRRLRAGDYVAESGFPVFRDLVRRWRHPNGLLWGMSVADYGHGGAWTESLGVIAPLQEMMLQSWDGALRIFPAWPKDMEARFERFRAEGAFLVSAAWAKGQVTGLTILSERGGQCLVYPPWPSGAHVVDDAGNVIQTTPLPGNRASFPTRAGGQYALTPAGRQ
ncbi:hypothetical protein HQ576_17325 [bacterium]|nr:hypothetical protein [bacterium]